MLYRETEIDLSGFELKGAYLSVYASTRIIDSSEGRIYVYGSLTVEDTSESGTGGLISPSPISYLINVVGGGSLRIDGGEMLGIIYADCYYTGGKGRIEINGGKFTGENALRMVGTVEVTVNGGRFECGELTFDCWAVGAELTLNGGVFVDTAVTDVEISDLSEILGVSSSGCELIIADKYGNEISEDKLASLSFY